MKNSCFLFVFLFFITTAEASATEVFVAINKLNTSIIDKVKISKILKAETLTWENGSSVVLLINDVETTESEAFKEVVSMTKSQFMEYWRIKFFSGRALIPKQIKTSSKAQTILVENHNSIFISIGKNLGKELTENSDLKVMSFKF